MAFALSLLAASSYCGLLFLPTPPHPYPYPYPHPHVCIPLPPPFTRKPRSVPDAKCCAALQPCGGMGRCADCMRA